MADVKFEVVRFAMSTAASGTYNVTITDFGTPSAVLFFTSEATTDDTIRSDSRLSIGSTDGTREWICSIASEDAVGTTESNRRVGDTGCVGLPTLGGTSWDALASAALITNGVQLTIVNQAAQAHLVTAVFIGGTDVTNAYVNYKDDLGNGTSPVAIADPLFTPDLVFAAVSGRTTLTGGQDSALSFGAAINDGSATQKGFSVFGADNLTTTTTSGYISSSAVTGELTATAVDYTTAVSSFDANGFSVQSSSAAGRSLIFYVALEFANSPDLALVDMTWPTSGDYAETGPGFQPDFGLICSLVGPTATDTIDAANGLALSVAAFDANNIYTTNYTDEDNVTSNTVAKSLSSDQLRILDPDGSTNSVVGTYAFDSSGWDFTLSTNPASAVLGWGLAFGDGVGGGGQTISVGAASETNSSFAVAAITAITIAVGAASETNTASAVTPINPNTITVGAASETNTASTVTPVIGTAPVVVIVGASSETDTASAVTAVNPNTITVGSASESNAAFTVTPTTAVVVKGVSITLYDGSTEQVSITGITAMWWDASPPTGNPVYTTATASTDVSGLLEIDLDASTALAIDGLGHLMLYKLDGVDQTDSLAWQGQLPIVDVG